MGINPSNDGIFPGGPTTPDIITDRSMHRCSEIWRGKADLPGKARLHGQALAKMNLEKRGPRREKLIACGFGYAISYDWKYTDINLCYAVAERFWSNTCTFHFPFGEMSITLQDTTEILGLPYTGAAVIASPCDDIEALVLRCLGKLPEDKHLADARKGRIFLPWLTSEFSDLPNNATPETVDCYTRAYLLALFGCILFPDSSGTFVDYSYLTILEDLSSMFTYAWGAAILAHLYSCLKNFVLSKNYSNIYGCAVLLQVWSHEHFPSIGTPKIMENLVPKAAKYANKGNIHYSQDPHHTIVVYRQEFDLLKVEQVVWAPYLWSPERVASIAHRACIIHFDDLYYHPLDRCMRQISCFQHFPADPPSYASLGRPSAAESASAFMTWWDAQNDPHSQFRIECHPVNQIHVAGAVSDAYRKWYGKPMLHNAMVTYPEPRYEPRGYGDPIVETILTRVTNVANLIDGACDQYSNVEPFCSIIRSYAAMLRELPQIPGEAMMAPLRSSHFPVQPQPHDMDDVYVPAPPDHSAYMDDDTPSGYGSPSASAFDYASGSRGYVTPEPYGQSSQYFPPEEVPPYEPTQQEHQFMRPRRSIRQVPTAVQLCPDCSGLQGRRCRKHI